MLDFSKKKGEGKSKGKFYSCSNISEGKFIWLRIEGGCVSVVKLMPHAASQWKRE